MAAAAGPLWTAPASIGGTVKGCSLRAAHFVWQRMGLHGRMANPSRCQFAKAAALRCACCAPFPPTPRRQEMRLSIGGLEVRPGVWRKAFDEGGYDSDAGEDREAGVALGYVAQVWNACLRVCACVQGGLGGRGALPVQHWSAHAALPLGRAVTVTPLLLLPPCCCCSSAGGPLPGCLPGSAAALPTSPARLAVGCHRQLPARGHLVSQLAGWLGPGCSSCLAACLWRQLAGLAWLPVAAAGPVPSALLPPAKEPANALANVSQLKPLAPPHTAAACRAEAEDGGRRSLFGARGADAAAAAAAADRAAAVRPVEYPLYCDSNRERPRFAGKRWGWLAGWLAGCVGASV